MQKTLILTNIRKTEKTLPFRIFLQLKLKKLLAFTNCVFKKCLIYCSLARSRAKYFSYARLGSKAVQKSLYSLSVAHSEAKIDVHVFFSC